MILTILIGAMAAIFIAFNLFEKKEKYGVVSFKTIALSVTYVILAVVVGSFLDNINTIFQGFHDALIEATFDNKGKYIFHAVCGHYQD